MAGKAATIEQNDASYISKAKIVNFRNSPRKARLVINAIRGKDVEEAIDILSFLDKKSAPVIKKVVLSAVANAKQSDVDIDELYIKKAWVDEGRKLMRWLPRAHGRATKLRKRSSTITVVLDERGA